MAEAYMQTEGMPGDAEKTKEGIVTYILQKNGLSREEYDSTMSWYGRNLDKYVELYAKVDKELQNRQKKLSGSGESTGFDKDLWPYARHILITPQSASDNISFHIETEEINKGDLIRWQMKTGMIPSGSLMLGVVYDDGVSGYTSMGLSSGKRWDIKVQTDTAKQVKYIFGNLHIDGISSVVAVDSLQLTAEPFDSLNYYRINLLKRYGGPVAKRKVFENETTEQESDN